MKLKFIWLAVAAGAVATANTMPEQQQAMRSSATKAVRLMERSVGAFAPNIPCASCHHNNFPLWAFSVAREHGIAVDAELNRRVAIKTYSFLKDVDRAVQGNFFVDPSLGACRNEKTARRCGLRKTSEARAKRGR